MSEVDQVRELKQPQGENTRLKQSVADLTLNNAMLQDAVKNILGPSQRQQAVKYYWVNERHACGVARLNRETFRYHWFTSLTKAQQIAETWRAEYDESRPHKALREKTPNEIAHEFTASRELMGNQTAENSLSG